MFKKVVSIIICTMMVSLSVYADGDDTTETVDSAEPAVYTISLADCINMATTENPQLEACDIKKENYETQLSAAKITKSNYKDNRTVYVSSGYEVTYIRGGYYVDSFQSALDLCDFERRQIESTLAYNATQKYFNYKNCMKLVDIASKSYDLAAENYNSMKLSYDLGLVSQNELDNAQLSLKRAEYIVQSYNNNCNLALDDLKIALRKNNEDCTLVLTDEIECGDYEGDLNADLVTAENSRYDINSLKSNYELKKKYLDLTGLPSTSAKYTSAYSDFITAEYNYTNNKDLILLGVKSSYNSISSAKNDLDIANDNLNLKNSAYNIAKIKYDQGMITNMELMSAMNDVSQAEIELENAKLTYKLAVEKYKYEISIGL